MTEASPRKEDKPEVGVCAYILYYLVLFFAYWFGAARFDFDGDGDFDPEDVEGYLRDKTFLMKNFGGKPVPNRPKRNAGRKSPRQPQGESPRSKSPEAGGGFDFGRDVIGDSNGDGQVDIMDAFESKVEGDDGAAEDRMLQNQRPPYFIITQIVVAFGFWVYFALTGPQASNFVVAKAGLDSLEDGKYDLRVHDDSCTDYRLEVWRWWTYQFTHVGAMHILMNCFLNMILGIPLEGLHGSLKLAFMFNVGVIGGACCFFFNDSHTAVVGMSGGCYSLIGIHLANLIMNWGQLKFRKPMLLFLLLLVGSDMASYFLALGAENASHSAHMGGAVAGAIMGILIGTNIDVTWPERIFQGIVFFIGLGLIGFSLAWLFTQWPPNNIWGGNGWCWVRQVWWYPLENFVCIRCGLQDCIDRYTAQAGEHIGQVSFAVCQTMGWYNEQNP